MFTPDPILTNLDLKTLIWLATVVRGDKILVNERLALSHSSVDPMINAMISPRDPTSAQPVWFQTLQKEEGD